MFLVTFGIHTFGKCELRYMKSCLFCKIVKATLNYSVLLVGHNERDIPTT